MIKLAEQDKAETLIEINIDWIAQKGLMALDKDPAASMIPMYFPAGKGPMILE